VTDSPRFSIVTVAYNQAAFIREAIDSVLSQGYPDLEYVVVDPGSTDGTRDIIETYRDRVSRIVFRPDRGAAEGLNHGFAEASGDIYGFLNSDDILLPGALHKVARVFADNPDVELVMGHVWIIDRAGRRIRKAYTDPIDRKAFAYGACTICQQATFFRPRAFHGAGGFDPANRVAWDGELFVEMLRNDVRHLVIDEMLGCFRIHDGSITGSRRARMLYEDVLRSRLFERLMGRPWLPTDALIQIAYLVRKYMLQPRSLWERLCHGSITGRQGKRR